MAIELNVGKYKLQLGQSKRIRKWKWKNQREKRSGKKKQIWNKPIRLLIDWYFTYSSTVETVKTEDWTVQRQQSDVSYVRYFLLVFISLSLSLPFMSCHHSDEADSWKEKNGIFSHFYSMVFSYKWRLFFFSCFRHFFPLLFHLLLLVKRSIRAFHFFVSNALTFEQYSQFTRIYLDVRDAETVIS